MGRLKQKRGFAILILIGSISIFAYFIVKNLIYIEQISIRNSNERKSFQIFRDSFNETIKNYLNKIPLKRIDCSAYRNIKIKFLLCSSQGRDFDKLLYEKPGENIPSPIVDTHFFDYNFERCDDENQKTTKITKNGRSIISDNFVSGTVCTLFRTEKTNYIGNLSFANLIATKEHLFSTGYIEIDELILKTDAIIYAAGDIFINKAENISDQAISLTIFSANGSVQFQSGEKSIALRIFSGKKSSVPSSLLSDFNQKIPVLKTIDITGVILDN